MIFLEVCGYLQCRTFLYHWSIIFTNKYIYKMCLQNTLTEIWKISDANCRLFSFMIHCIYSDVEADHFQCQAFVNINVEYIPNMLRLITNNHYQYKTYYKFVLVNYYAYILGVIKFRKPCWFYWIQSSPNQDYHFITKEQKVIGRISKHIS